MIRHRSLKHRNNRGAQIAEFVAALTIVVPLFMFIVFLTFEVASYMYFKTAVDAAARTEARWLAINFNSLVQQNGNSAGGYANWKNPNVRIANCIVSEIQFVNGTIDGAGNFVLTSPQTEVSGSCLPTVGGQGVVAVKVSYPGGSGLPNWPASPVGFLNNWIMPGGVSISSISVADIEP